MYVKTCCFLCFGLLVRQKKLSEDVTVGYGKWAFFPNLKTKRLIMKIISRSVTSTEEIIFSLLTAWLVGWFVSRIAKNRLEYFHKSSQVNFIYVAQNHNHDASVDFTICTVQIHPLSLVNRLKHAQLLDLFHFSPLQSLSPPHLTSVLCSSQRRILPGHHNWHGAHHEHVHSWAVWRHCHGEYKACSLLPLCLHPRLPLCSLIVSAWTLFRFCQLTQSRRDLHWKGVLCLLEARLKTGLAGSHAFQHNDICAGTPSTSMSSSLLETPSCTKEYV